MKHPVIETIEDLRKRHRKPVNPNVQVERSMSPLDKFALKITDTVGSIGFFFIILIWTIFWLGWNTLAPKEVRFDPFPAFVLWLFISNMIQIFLMPLIMIGQNLQSQHAEIRAESDFEINVKAEQEIETILMHLENQSQMIIELIENSRNSNSNSEESKS